MLTNERAMELVEYLNSDKENAERLFALPVEEAAEEINKDGYDFTAEELAEFAQAVIDASENGELDDSSLE